MSKIATVYVGDVTQGIKDIKSINGRGSYKPTGDSVAVFQLGVDHACALMKCKVADMKKFSADDQTGKVAEYDPN